MVFEKDGPGSDLLVSHAYFWIPELEGWLSLSELRIVKMDEALGIHWSNMRRP